MEKSLHVKNIKAQKILGSCVLRVVPIYPLCKNVTLLSWTHSQVSPFINLSLDHPVFCLHVVKSNMHTRTTHQMKETLDGRS